MIPSAAQRLCGREENCGFPGATWPRQRHETVQENSGFPGATWPRQRHETVQETNTAYFPHSRDGTFDDFSDL